MAFWSNKHLILECMNWKRFHVYFQVCEWFESINKWSAIFFIYLIVSIFCWSIKIDFFRWVMWIFMPLFWRRHHWLFMIYFFLGSSYFIRTFLPSDTNFECRLIRKRSRPPITFNNWQKERLVLMEMVQQHHNFYSKRGCSMNGRHF